MTTKDFLLRMQRFSSLDKASEILSMNTSLDFIYHVTGSLVDGSSIDTYVISLLDLPGTLVKCEYNSLYFLRFSRYDFSIQLKYFKSFLKTISKNQYQVLRDNRSCDSLLLSLGYINTQEYLGI